MRHLSSIILWTIISAVGSTALGVLALHDGETINAAWLLTAALCTYAVGYRFYSRIISRQVFQLDDARPTPAVRLENGHDFVPTHQSVVFGHHFAAIAGAGPLLGPILAAQFGYLPGALWVIVGVVLGGAVQDFVILCASLRRDGRSLGQLAREEIGPIGGWMALIGVFFIVLLLIAVLAMTVVNVLSASPWGVVSVGLTIPIGLMMGIWMRWIRPGRILEASALGLIGLGVALALGKWAADDPHWHQVFTVTPSHLAWAIVIYGFSAAVLPVWMLLAPRDYLSAFLKIGTLVLLAIGVFIALPPLYMPKLVSQFNAGGPFQNGHGPITPGTLFPFAFITIACGSISGFHALVASGTTPKLLARETQARAIGYGAMLTESFVAVLALIAACALTPGLYFAMGSPIAKIGADPALAAAAITGWGFPITADELIQTAHQVGESSILSRVGGAACLAVGMAKIFAKVFTGPTAMAWWYHFAILFEALFILTTIDAGTRIGRFILQGLLGAVATPFQRVSWLPGVWLCSALVAGGWGWFLLAGVNDPRGGIYTLWPVFGLANQVLAAIALCVGTAVMVRMGKARYTFLTLIPLVWLIAVTETAGYDKLFSPATDIGFIAQAHAFQAKAVALQAKPAMDAAAQALRDGQVGVLHRQRLNAWIDAGLCAAFMLAIFVVAIDTLRECLSCLKGGTLRGSSPPLMRTPEVNGV